MPLAQGVLIGQTDKVMRHELVVKVDGASIPLTVDGEALRGPNTTLIGEGDDLTGDQPWADAGFTVLSFLTDDVLSELQNTVLDVVKSAIQAVGSDPGPNFDPADYAAVVEDQATHMSVVEMARANFQKNLSDDVLDQIDRHVSGGLNFEVESRNPTTDRPRCQLRIARPGRPDFNPPHKDAWIEHLRNGLNLYAPLFGSNERTSLALVPGSHLWAENAISRTRSGAIVNGLKFNVPSVVEDLEMVRPNPPPKHAMLFSPYIIHGLGVNLDVKQTRFSLEMRFWRKRADR